MSFRLILSSSSASLEANEETNDFTTNFTNPLYLPGSWEMCLQEVNLYYSWFNISAEKNNDTVRYYNGTLYRPSFQIPSGQYTAPDLNDAIHRVMKTNGDFTLVGTVEVYDINIVANYATGKIRIELSNNYRFDLTLSDLYLLLGFNKIEVLTTQEGAKLADINDSINTIYVRTDILDPSVSYLNDVGSDILDSFVPNSIPYTSLQHRPFYPVYLPIRRFSGDRVNKIRLYLTDDLGRRLNLNDQPFAVNLHFRKSQII